MAAIKANEQDAVGMIVRKQSEFEENSHNFNNNGPSLSDMPIEVIHNIVDYVDPINILVIRKVCRKLRNVLDGDPKFKDVHLHQPTSLDMNFSLELDDSLSAMLDDCAVILKNPKVRLDYFNISINDDQNTKIAKWLQEIVGSQHKIHSTNVTLSSFKTFDFISMLSFFKPGALETIDFGRLTNFTDFSQLTNLFEMDQWKFAQRVYLLSMDFDNFPIEQLSHLISFDIEWTETSVADAIKIKDIILRSPHFESASILSHCVNKIKPEVLKVFHPNYIATDRDYNEMLELRNDYFRSIVYAGGSSIDIYNVNLEDPDDFE